MNMDKINELAKDELAKYKKKYDINNIMPDNVNIIIENTTDFIGCVKRQEILDKQYNVYISSVLFANFSAKTFTFMHQVLFHEFTHIYDIIEHKDDKDIHEYMKSYSEYRACYRELKEIIFFIPDFCFLKLDAIINTRLKEESIKDFMEHKKSTFEHEIINTIMDKREFDFTILDSTYYFYGYLDALKEIGIEYDYILFKNKCKPITEYLEAIHNALQQNDIDKTISLYKGFVVFLDKIKQTFKNIKED